MVMKSKILISLLVFFDNTQRTPVGSKISSSKQCTARKNPRSSGKKMDKKKDPVLSIITIKYTQNTKKNRPVPDRATRYGYFCKMTSTKTNKNKKWTPLPKTNF